MLALKTTLHPGIRVDKPSKITSFLSIKERKLSPWKFSRTLTRQRVKAGWNAQGIGTLPRMSFNRIFPRFFPALGSPNITPTNTDLRYSPTPEPKLGDDPDKADSRQGDEVGTTKSSLSNKRATQSALLTAFATITGYLVVRWSLWLNTRWQGLNVYFCKSLKRSWYLKEA